MSAYTHISIAKTTIDEPIKKLERVIPELEREIETRRKDAVLWILCREAEIDPPDPDAHVKLSEARVKADRARAELERFKQLREKIFNNPDYCRELDKQLEDV